MRRFVKPYPLAKRMMLIVIGWSLLFTLITTAIQIFLMYEREMNSLNARLQQIKVIEVPGLVNSLWHFNDKQIEIQLQGMLNLQDIRFIELQLTSGEVFQAGEPILTGDALTRSFELEFTQNDETYPLGQLFVMADIRTLRMRVMGWLFQIIFNAGIQTFLFAALILFVVDKLLTRPLNEIVHSAENINLEHLEEPLSLKPRKDTSPNDELDTLVLKLNEMRTRLMEDVNERLRMEEALRESERNYREIFNTTSEAIIIRDMETGKIVQVNEPMLRMYGYPSEDEVLDLTIAILSSNEPTYSEARAQELILKSKEEGPQIFEWHARRKNGELFWAEISVRATIIRGKDRILSVVRNIDERKQAETLLEQQHEALMAQQQALEEAEAETRRLNIHLERRVEERTLQLAALNRELEAFSYSIAHDLRAPLRHMNGFSQILLNDYAGEFDEDVQHLLQRIQEASQKMAEMVDALLSLSRISRGEIEITRIDISSLVNSIAEELRQQEPAREVQFNIFPGLQAHADVRLLNIVLENLLSNAWKFTAHRHPAVIEFGCLSKTEYDSLNTDEEMCFFLRDNGAGFNMAIADRLFVPFQRLHTVSEFSGTGIGLATVFRIIQRHGGRIWAEAEVDQGATFYFTLPGTSETCI